jgi:hypothetical protein
MLRLVVLREARHPAAFLELKPPVGCLVQVTGAAEAAVVQEERVSRARLLARVRAAERHQGHEALTALGVLARAQMCDESRVRPSFSASAVTDSRLSIGRARGLRYPLWMDLVEGIPTASMNRGFGRGADPSVLMAGASIPLLLRQP